MNIEGNDVVKIWNNKISIITKTRIVNNNKILFQHPKGYFDVNTMTLVIEDNDKKYEYKNCKIKYHFGVVLVVQIYKNLLENQNIPANISFVGLIKIKMITWKRALRYYRVTGEIVYLKQKSLFA